MIIENSFDAMFGGIIGQEYQMLKLISPLATEMSRLVGEAVSEFAKKNDHSVQVVELGGGTGITSLAILSAAENIQLFSIDNEPIMQNQARQNLHSWLENGRLVLSGNDALTALNLLNAQSVDIVATAYTLHNFESQYRFKVLAEIFRVLKPNGHFINGDRYALDDISLHTRTIQAEVAGYFKVLTSINRLDLLEKWIIHLFNDESENHVMRESLAQQQMANLGFQSIQFKFRMQVNALMFASKPS